MEQNSSRPRYAGTDPATGKRILVVAQPGGALERTADLTAVESGAVLAALIGEILDAGKASEAELSALVVPLHAALTEVTEVAARLMDQHDVREPLFGSAARAMGEALKRAGGLL